MKLKDKMRSTIKPNLLKGGLLTMVLLPFAVVTILKFIYVVIHHEALFRKFSEGYLGLLAKFAWIRWLWPFTPPLSVTPVLSWGNFFGLLLVGMTIWGVALVGSAYSTYNRLRKGKWDADNDQLRDDFRT